MSFNHGLPHPALLLLGAMLCTGGSLNGRAADLQPMLLGDSPFSQTVAAPANSAPGVEFRGLVQEGNICLVNLYLSATKLSHWIPVGAEAAGLQVTSYDKETGLVSVIQAGRPISLPLKQSRVALQGNNLPLKLLDPAERVSAGEAPAMPDFMRDLPPEARKLLEEARRRRAIRWPELPAGPITPKTTP